MPVPIFLIANPRSGTHLLRGFMRGGSQVEDLSEVFHPGEMKDRPHGFFRFLEQQVAANPGVAVPHPDGRARLFDDYMAHLEGLACAPHFVIDAKYDNTHHFNGIWHHVDEMPRMISLIRERRYPVIHLVRRNLLEMYCSNVLARATNYWSHPSGRAYAPPTGHSVTIEVQNLVMNLERIRIRIAFFTWCLRDYAPVVNLAYEDLLEEGNISTRVQAAISGLIGEHLDATRTPAYFKVSPPLRHYVANYDEVIRALSGTPFLSMVS